MLPDAITGGAPNLDLALVSDLRGVPVYARQRYRVTIRI